MTGLPLVFSHEIDRLGGCTLRFGLPRVSRNAIGVCCCFPGGTARPLWLAAVLYCRPGNLASRGPAGLYAEVLETGKKHSGALPLILTGHLPVGAATCRSSPSAG